VVRIAAFQAVDPGSSPGRRSRFAANAPNQTFEKWSLENEIAVNKKKSGILTIDKDRHDKHKYREYPMKVTYKYLGIKLNRQMCPRAGLDEMNKKLEVYLSRSNWINKKCFSPKSLITLAGYYQHSRLIYGMSCFLDRKDIVESVEKSNIKYSKSILGLSNQVNSNRLRLILGKPLGATYAVGAHEENKEKVQRPLWERSLDLQQSR
jgi:hypothetical protein